MGKRIGISPKTRFEVFKRDSFKCQYCGRSSPDVLLQVDHIHPVSKGGDNDILNFITSCVECNIGKGARTLDDNSIIKKQKQQLDELNEKREQLKMMMDWRRALIKEQDECLELIKERYEIVFRAKLAQQGICELRRILNRFGLEETLIAIDIASTRSLDPEDRKKYIWGICRNRKLEN